MKDIKGYEGLYAVTKDGQVWSYKSKKFLKPYKAYNGYLRVSLIKDGDRKNKRVHRLVMETFYPTEGMDDLEVDHIDFNIENNSLNNLRWLSKMENCCRHKNNGYKKVCCIETSIIYSSIKEASKQTGVCQSGISQCCNSKQKTAGGFHWEFVVD